jgi:hypothetical protein
MIDDPPLSSTSSYSMNIADEVVSRGKFLGGFNGFDGIVIGVKEYTDE